MEASSLLQLLLPGMYTGRLRRINVPVLTQESLFCRFIQLVGRQTRCLWKGIGGKSRIGCPLSWVCSTVNIHLVLLPQGEEIVKNIEKQGSNSGAPKVTVTIKDSGELK